MTSDRWAKEDFVTDAIATALAGLDVKPDVAYAATSALPACTYSNGSSGVGATLTGNANGPLLIDGVTILVAQAGSRVLIAAQAAPAQDGWYTITQVGVVAVSPFILTRATESDQAAEIGAGYLTGVVAPNGVTAGSNNGKLYISVAANPFVVGTTALTFSQVGSTYSAGTGIGLSGTTFSIDTAITVDKTTAQTLTNKTLTSPVVNTPTGIVKGDVGLGNVDNTADTAKAFAGTQITSGTVPIARLPLDADVATLSLPASTTISSFVAAALDETTVGAFLTALGIDADLATLAVPASTTISSFVAGALDETTIAAFLTALGVDADIATLSLPASTTITAFGASLVDDANAAAALTTLGLDADIATLALPASTTISAFGASLIDDAASSNARTTLALGNVDNTSDANKPVSTAQQTALDLKANIASPTFTGTPAAPTAAANTNTTQVATTAFVTASRNYIDRTSARRNFY